jgi:hypothetical protein
MGTPYLPTLRSTLIHINLAGERTKSNEKYQHAKDGGPKDNAQASRMTVTALKG